MVTTKQPWSDVLTDPTRGGSQNLYNLLAGIGEGGQADPTGKFAMGPQNAFSDEQMRKFQTSGLRNLQAGNRAFNAGAGMSAAARGVAGPDLATMLGNQQSANTRDTLANMQWQAQQAGQKLGMDQYDQLLKALGIVGPQATTESQQSLDALLAGLQGGEATGTGEGTADAGYTTAAQRQAAAELAEKTREFGEEQSLEKLLEGYQEETGTTAEQRQAEAELAQLAEQFGLTQEQARTLAGYEEATGTTAEQRQAAAELAEKTREFGEEQSLEKLLEGYQEETGTTAEQRQAEAELKQERILAGYEEETGTTYEQRQSKTLNAINVANSLLQNPNLNQYEAGTGSHDEEWRYTEQAIALRKQINAQYEIMGLEAPFDEDDMDENKWRSGNTPLTFDQNATYNLQQQLYNLWNRTTGTTSTVSPTGGGNWNVRY